MLASAVDKLRRASIVLMTLLIRYAPRLLVIAQHVHL